MAKREYIEANKRWLEVKVNGIGKILFTLFALVVCCYCYGQNDRLPVVRISAENLSTSFSDATFQIDDTLTLPIDIRYRGSRSLKYTKKSFAIKLKDEEGNKNDKALMGMRCDNSWILDAMAIDRARMRNRISMDLWNDFSSESYITAENPASRNGTDGRFVEVYMNGEYWGIYCLSEKIDRKLLKLKKYKEDKVRGALYKSFAWTTLYSTNSQYYLYDNTKDVWNGWEIAYPDVDAGEPIDWAPLSEDIYWLSKNSSRVIAEGFEKKFDVPVWKDYFLLMELIVAEDNVCKNQYVYYYDSSSENRMMGVAPWDMDHSWGRNYDGEINGNTSPGFNLVTNYNRVQYVMQYIVYKNSKYLKDRYSELRKSYFSEKELEKRFHDVFLLFDESGAAEREKARWNGVDGIELDFDAEKEYISQWIHDRLAYMDKKYGYVPTGIMPVDTSSHDNGMLYDLSGRCMGRESSNLRKGLYIKNRKVISY